MYLALYISFFNIMRFIFLFNLHIHVRVHELIALHPFTEHTKRRRNNWKD